MSLLMKNYNFLPVLFTISAPLIDLANSLGIPYYYGYQSVNFYIFICRHNSFFYPYVSGIFRSIFTDIQSDYYGVINADILINNNIFHLLDLVDDLVEKGEISEIV